MIGVAEATDRCLDGIGSMKQINGTATTRRWQPLRARIGGHTRTKADSRGQVRSNPALAVDNLEVSAENKSIESVRFD